MSPDFSVAEWQRLWSAWNIRVCLILAVILQLILTFCAPFRRRTSSQFRILIVWLSYLLSDWMAVFVYGLITNSINRSCPGQSSQVSEDNLALWAAYLLVQLGGPDSITAFSLEDNALWPRHLVSLVAQVSVFLYIFGEMLTSKNNLMVHPIMVLVAGVITYGERSRSLYLASLDRMKRLGDEPLLSIPVPDIDQSWRFPYELSKVLKGLVVDIMPSKAKLQRSREFFLKVDAKASLDVLTKEMSFLYDMLYTKTVALRSGWGRISRIVSSLSLGIVAVWLSSLEKQERNEIDYWITILLVYETFLLQIVSTFMFYCPYWKFGNSNFGIIIRTMLGIPKKLWSETIGTFNLLTYCFEGITQREGCSSRSAFSSIDEKLEMAEVIAEFQHASKIPFDIQLWKFVFDELKVSLGTTDADSLADDALMLIEIYEARGNLALRRANLDDLMPFICKFEYESTLLIWHIATIICFHLDDAYKEDEIYNRKFSETISSYMVYLMVQQPKLVSPVIGIGYERYRHTCDEMKHRGRTFNSTDMKDFCIKLQRKYEDNGEPWEARRSVLQDSCNLATILLNKDKKWQIISKVWVELLSFAAGHCRGESYARVISQGGEFISFVWLLMAHLGIGPGVPVE